MKMHKIERHKQILSLLQDKEVITVEEICERLKSSLATVRRDLNDLDKSGLLIRVHGGAAKISRRLSPANFETNLSINQKKKQAIAKYAASMCAEGDSIILNGGTTTWQMCEWIKGKSLQILTNSLPIADTLQSEPQCRIFLTGGEVYSDQHIVLGDYESSYSREFFASKIFAGAHAITQHGLMESDKRLIQSEKMLISQAEQLIVVADSSKFTNKGLLQLCSLDKITILITDDGLPDGVADMLFSAGIDLIIVEE